VPADDEFEARCEPTPAEHREIRQALEARLGRRRKRARARHVMHSFELLTTILAHGGAEWSARRA
jgi:hypothetical protein